ncbi:hypothetical protein BGX20_006698 [Mortierella sp. AD010]|nr:hypothetical protein BGX20_006698 [Mortierella sp. AD010]
MSLTSSNSSSDSIANPQPLRLSSSSKPKSLSEELSSVLQSNGNDTSIGNNKAMAYPSPITPSDLLGIPDPSTFSSATLTPSDSPVQKADAGHKPRPSLLSINTTLGNSALEDTGFTFPQGSPTSMRDSATNSEGPGSPRVNTTSVPGDHTPPLPRLSHSSSHSSSASNSSFSNPSSPNSITPHSHQHHHHYSCPHHKHDRNHRHHHPSCHHAPGHRHGVRSDRATKGLGRHGIPQLDEHEGELSSLSPPEEGQLDNPEKEMSMGLGIEVTPSSTTTAVTIVGSTPAFGIHAFREQEDQENNALGLYSAEPPKKRQRSAAAVLLGAAVETVIFTSAVALSAYQLLTGKGKQQLEDATMTPTPDETTEAERTVLEQQSEMSIVVS